MTDRHAVAEMPFPALVLPRETPRTAVPVLEEIARERAAQIAQGYTAAEDDCRLPEEWLALIRGRLDQAAPPAPVLLAGRVTPVQWATWRRQLIVAAALACAALEAFDRAADAAAISIPPSPAEAGEGRDGGMQPPCDEEG